MANKFISFTESSDIDRLAEALDKARELFSV